MPMPVRFSATEYSSRVIFGCQTPVSICSRVVSMPTCWSWSTIQLAVST